MTRVDEIDACLRHMTHDAREILNLIGDTRPKIYWQIKLMEYCHNFNVTTLISNLKKLIKENPTQNLKFFIEHIPDHRLGKMHKQVAFTDRGIINMFRIDRLALVSDYAVRLDVLADLVNNMDITEIDEVVSESGRTGMGLILVKLQEHVGERDRMRRNISHMVAEPIKPVVPMTDEARSILSATIAELDTLIRPDSD